MVDLGDPAVPSRVLVVDDDPTFARFVCSVAERQAVHATVSTTGTDALACLAQGWWAGLLLDLALPDVHGLAVLRQLRQMGSRMPVIVLTDAGSVPLAIRVMKLGALDLLEKPVSEATLASALSSLLNEAARQSTQRGFSRFTPPRIQKLARVVVGFVGTHSDVRTSDALCRASGVFISSRTFRAWCLAEGVRASALLDLARVLRAVQMARTHGCSVADCLECDHRTVLALLRRGGYRPDWSSPLMAWDDLCREQVFVQQPLLVAEVVRLLTSEQRPLTES